MRYSSVTDGCDICDRAGPCSCDHVCDECEVCGDNTCNQYHSDEFDTKEDERKYWRDLRAKIASRNSSTPSEPKQCLACFFTPCQCFGKRKKAA